MNVNTKLGWLLVGLYCNVNTIRNLGNTCKDLQSVFFGDSTGGPSLNVWKRQKEIAMKCLKEANLMDFLKTNNVSLFEESNASFTSKQYRSFVCLTKLLLESMDEKSTINPTALSNNKAILTNTHKTLSDALDLVTKTKKRANEFFEQTLLGQCRDHEDKIWLQKHFGFVSDPNRTMKVCIYNTYDFLTNNQFASSVLKYRKVNPNTVDDDGFSSMHVAIFCGHPETVKLLLECPNIDPNIKEDETGDTPLMTAIMHDQEECFDLLLKHPKIDVGIENKHGRTALGVAKQRNKQNYITKLENYHK